MEEQMTNVEFKTLIEMIIEIIKASENKEDAIKKLENLTIMKD